jgi:hypothetical protein
MAGQPTNRVESHTGSTIPEGRDRAGAGRDPDGRREEEDSLVHAAVALRRFAVAGRAAASAAFGAS